MATPPAKNLTFIEERGLKYQERVGAMTITTPEQYVIACELEKEIAAGIKETESYFEPIRKAAVIAHKAVLAQEARATEPYEKALERVVHIRLQYEKTAEQERKQREAERRAEVTEQTKAETTQIATMLRDAGEDDLAENIEKNVVIPTVYEESFVPAVKGIGTKKGFGYEITDEKLIKPEFMMLVPNEKAIEAIVNTQGFDAIKLVGPGIAVFETTKGTRRAGRR